MSAGTLELLRPPVMPRRQVQAPSLRDWAGLVAMSLAVGLVIVDMTIVNVAIPAIIADLKISASTAQWVQESYGLSQAALLLTFGRLADRFGRRRVLLIGVVASPPPA